jgi:hypothetical protein
MLLVVVDDRHAESALRRALAAARERGDTAAVLTADALLAMRLRREGIDARLTTDGLCADPDAADNTELKRRDQIALDGVDAALGSYATFDGTDFAPYLQYTLMPSFMRAVRYVTAVEDQLAATSAAGIVLAGTGMLVDAARLVAARRALPIDRVNGDPFTRITLGLARLRAGRTTRWVDTNFRALVLEPGFLSMLFLKGFWRRLTQPAAAPPHPDAVIVAGDRFTADVMQRLRTTRQIVLAGATQPGRALFDGTPSLVPLESFGEWGDIFRTMGTMIDAAQRAISLATDGAHGAQFVAGRGRIAYWPLVRRASALHILIWIQKLRHVQRLAARAAHAAPRGQLLTSNDVTAYNRVLVDTSRRFGLTSIGIQHGMTAEPNGHSIAHVDALATWGEQTEHWYRAQAPQKARFIVTGNPRFDTLAARIGLSPVPVRSPLVAEPVASAPTRPDGASASQAGFTVCVCTGFVNDFTTGASQYENLLMIDAVLQWAAGKDAVRVIHKLHPGEEAACYSEAARALQWDPLKLTTIGEPILYDILERSQVLVASYSSTVLESLALGTPAIVFDGVLRRKLLHGPDAPLNRVPGVAIAYSPDDLKTLLNARQAAPPPDRAALRASAELREYLSGLDGEAAARVAALLA